MRGDLGGQISGSSACATLAAHADPTFNRPEQHLASGLYPGPLQFKHQV